MGAAARTRAPVRACPALLVLPYSCSPQFLWSLLLDRSGTARFRDSGDRMRRRSFCWAMLAYLVVAWVDAFTPLISCCTPLIHQRIEQHHLGHRGEQNVCGVPGLAATVGWPHLQARAESLPAHCGLHGRQAPGVQCCWASDLGARHCVNDREVRCGQRLSLCVLPLGVGGLCSRLNSPTASSITANNLVSKRREAEARYTIPDCDYHNSPKWAGSTLAVLLRHQLQPDGRAARARQGHFWRVFTQSFLLGYQPELPGTFLYTYG